MDRVGDLYAWAGLSTCPGAGDHTEAIRLGHRRSTQVTEDDGLSKRALGRVDLRVL